MNYHHAYHAGNFADVFKHALISRVLIYLMRKDAPLRYIDTHAGAGLYRLDSEAARTTGEWRDGVGRLGYCDMPGDVAALMTPYLNAAGILPGAELASYPGSPLLAQHLLRADDRLTLCELHPVAAKSLTRAIGRDRRVKILQTDGYAGLNAMTPPVERRGLVLLDPPFEAADEFDHMTQAIEAAWRKWPTGVYMAWYPCKDARKSAGFGDGLTRAGIRRVLRLECAVAQPQPDGPLSACGLILINPPHGLAAEARMLLPWLTQVMARGRGATWSVEQLAGE